MPDQPQAVPTFKSSETVPAVPSSSSEVSMRTMQSDVELMGKSGGVPAGQVTHFAQAPDASAVPGPTGAPAPQVMAEKPDSRWMKPLVWTLIVIAGIAILFAAGFYLAPLFS